MHTTSRDTIRDACHHYIESSDNHEHSLVIEDCDGQTYAECFVLVGTGGAELVGSRRVFYAQVKFTAAINYDAEPLVIPLFSTLMGAQRRLVIDTAGWNPEEQRDFREDLRKAVLNAKAAFFARELVRPWVFFVSTEEYLDQNVFYADLYPGLDTFVCEMPPQQRRFRPTFFRAPPSPHDDPRQTWDGRDGPDTSSTAPNPPAGGEPDAALRKEQAPDVPPTASHSTPQGAETDRGTPNAESDFPRPPEFDHRPEAHDESQGAPEGRSNTEPDAPSASAAGPSPEADNRAEYAGPLGGNQGVVPDPTPAAATPMLSSSDSALVSGAVRATEASRTDARDRQGKKGGVVRRRLLQVVSKALVRGQHLAKAAWRRSVSWWTWR
jgi:hypothetical protein